MPAARKGPSAFAIQMVTTRKCSSSDVCDRFQFSENMLNEYYA